MHCFKHSKLLTCPWSIVISFWVIDECCGGVAVSDQDKERKQQKKKGIHNEDILKLGGAYEVGTN